MPDSSYLIKCDTRRELKAEIQSEIDNQLDSGMAGLTKRDAAWAAAHA